MIAFRPVTHHFRTAIWLACALLFAGTAAARNFSVQTLSDTNINSRGPSIGDTGLVAWQGYTLNDGEDRMAQRQDVAATPDAQRCDIYMWKNGNVRNMTTDDPRIVGRSEHARVFQDSVVFMAWFGNEQEGGYPFTLSVPPKNPQMLQMESEYPTLFDPPTSAVEAEQIEGEEPAEIPETAPLTDEEKEQNSRQTQNWRSSGHSADVALIDPDGNIQRITPGTRTFSFPVASEKGIAFQCARGWPYGYEILAWSAGQSNLIQITTNYFYVLNPQMQGSELVFQAWDGNDYEIFLYNFDTKLCEQITDNQFDDVYPVVWDGQIAWMAHPTVTAEIFLYRDGVIRKISEGTQDNRFPTIWNGRVVWQGYDDTDLEIYYFNGSRTIKLTSNTWDDLSPQIRDGVIAWTSYVDNWDSEIMVLDLSDNIAQQLTNNDLEDSGVQTAGERVVWQVLQPEGGLIQMATPDLPRTDPIN